MIAAAMDDVQHAIIEMLEREFGVPRAKLNAAARLSEDLGLDGDDVWGLLNRLQRRFGTDFSALYAQWSDYFNAEGYSAGVGLIGAAVLATAVAAGFVVFKLFGVIGVAAEAFVLVCIAIAVGRRKAGRRSVTIAGLADIVRQGAWPQDASKVN